MMTAVQGTLTGTHPLSENTIQSILDYKYGRAGNKPVIEKFDQDLNKLLQLQSELEYTYQTTANLGIEDLIRPFTRSLDALKSYEELGDLPINRYHYTNTFYRQPTVVEKLPDSGNVVITDKNTITHTPAYSLEYIKSNEAKIVLPGPVSFTRLVAIEDDGPYSSYEEFIDDAASYLASEYEALPKNYVQIQLDEPYLVWERIPRTKRPSIKDAYEQLRNKLPNRELIVHTYFESAEPVLSFLLDLPIDGIGIDFFKTNILDLKNYDFEGKIIQAGLIDSQNYVPNENGQVDETENSFLAGLIRSLEKLNPKRIDIGPTTSLEYVPREIADQKLRQIKNIVDLVKEEYK